MPGRPAIALVSREVWPFYAAGGIGRHVHGTAAALAPHADVTVVLPDTFQGRIAAGDARLLADVRYLFAREPKPEELPTFTSLYHAWSASACDALRTLSREGRLDLVEFPDFTGEGAVTIQARHSGDTAFANTRIAVRTHGSDELHRSFNGQTSDTREAAAIASLERIALRGADVVLVARGGVHATYERMYADTGLARVRAASWPIPLTPAPAPRPGPRDRPLRLLHLGRLERRKGVEDLVRAVVALDRNDVRLTLLGRDTPTGPGGASMLEHLRRIAAGDPRVEFRRQVDHQGAMAATAEHDVMVLSSRWECYPNTAREALALGRPVLATPVGGLLQIVEEGVNGWFSEQPGEPALAAAIERLLSNRADVDGLVGSEGVAKSLAAAVDNETAVSELLEEASGELGATGPGGPARPTVGVVVVARDGGGSVADTLWSLARQTARAADVVVAPQGRHAARAVAPFVNGDTSRLGDAGEVADGDLVVITDGGTIFAPGYLKRIADAYEADPELAFITTWSNAEEPGQARPLGLVPRLAEDDWGGEVLAVSRPLARDALADSARDELAGGAAWLVARRLVEQGGRGAVVPEELIVGRWSGARASVGARRDEVRAALRTTALGFTPGGRAATRAPRARASDTPLISVLMAAYNAEATIRASVESALGQAEERIELIVIDDGSNVPVTEVLSDVRDDRLRIVRHPRNCGLARARNTALREAGGALVAQLDADDVWTPDYATSILPCFEDAWIGLAYSNARLLGHPDSQELYIPDPTVHPLDHFPKFAEQNPVPSLTATMRAEAVRAVGGWAPWLRHALDYHLYAKLIMAGWRFAYVDRPLGWYRWPEPERGMSYDRRVTELSELKMWLAFVLRHPRVPGPRRQVRLRLARELRTVFR